MVSVGRERIISDWYSDLKNHKKMWLGKKKYLTMYVYIYTNVYIYPAKMTFLGNNLFLNISGSDCCNKTVSRAYMF